jgi:hypothetical protein
LNYSYRFHPGFKILTGLSILKKAAGFSSVFTVTAGAAELGLFSSEVSVFTSSGVPLAGLALLLPGQQLLFLSIFSFVA